MMSEKELNRMVQDEIDMMYGLYFCPVHRAYMDVCVDCYEGIDIPEELERKV